MFDIICSKYKIYIDILYDACVCQSWNNLPCTIYKQQFRLQAGWTPFRFRYWARQWISSSSWSSVPRCLRVFAKHMISWYFVQFCPYFLDSAPGLSLAPLQPAESRPMETSGPRVVQKDQRELSLGSSVNLPMPNDWISQRGWSVRWMHFSLPWLWPINRWLILTTLTHWLFFACEANLPNDDAWDARRCYGLLDPHRWNQFPAQAFWSLVPSFQDGMERSSQRCATICSRPNYATICSQHTWSPRRFLRVSCLQDPSGRRMD